MLFGLIGSEHTTPEGLDYLCKVLLALSKQTCKSKELSYYIIVLITIIGINLDEMMVERLLYMKDWKNDVSLAMWIASFMDECRFGSK
jgi:hypothetical protein